MTAEIRPPPGRVYDDAGASMRPRSNDRGNMESRMLTVESKVASMRPRSNDRGNLYNLTRRATQSPSFNEAAI